MFVSMPVSFSPGSRYLVWALVSKSGSILSNCTASLNAIDIYRHNLILWCSAYPDEVSILSEPHLFSKCLFVSVLAIDIGKNFGKQSGFIQNVFTYGVCSRQFDQIYIWFLRFYQCQWAFFAIKIILGTSAQRNQNSQQNHITFQTFCECRWDIVWRRWSCGKAHTSLSKAFSVLPHLFPKVLSVSYLRRNAWSAMHFE